MYCAFNLVTPLRENRFHCICVLIFYVCIKDYSIFITCCTLPMFRPVQLVVPDTVVGSFVLQVIAYDRDSGTDGHLDYRITRVTQNGAQIPPNIFAINYTTGVITVTELLAEGLYNYTITVVVADMGSSSLMVTRDFTVEVIGRKIFCIAIPELPL